MSSSYLPPSMLSKRVKWDVFLSFRGEDTRHTITASLCDVLKREGLRVFIDNVGMEKGDVINSSLEEGIMDSALAVAIISPKYADSRWCLHELCQLLRSCKRIIPVFYQVHPSDVRRQNGDFGKGFQSLIDSCKDSQPKEEMLRKALKAVGNLSGYPCHSESDEKEVLQHIVKQVLEELKNTPEFVAKITVGLDSRVDEVVQKLAIQSSGVRFLGIHGTPGIGKTTLAKAAFNKLAAHFRKRCFVSNVRELLANKGGVLKVQNKIIQDLSTEDVTEVEQESDGKRKIKITVDEDRVLVVLDDVSDVNQLESIGIFREWFHEGSRIIITSRNKDVLVPFPCNNNELHEADKLSDSESLELFCIHAFGRTEPTKEYLGISEKIVSLTDGLPLALEVFGSSLVKKTYGEWKDSLSKMKEIRDDKLQGVLKISYDALDVQEKTAFLDISCLLLQMNMKRGDVADIFEGCGLRAELAIGNLVTKSLMKISEKNDLWMHDQIKDMGKQIVREESLDDPGKRSRLWDSGDIKRVLRHEKATDAIHGIVLDAKKPPNELTNERTSWFHFRRHPSITTGFNYLAEKFKELTEKHADEDDNLVLYTQSFAKMTNLKLLQINYLELRGNADYIPSELRCLLWRGCSKTTLSENIPEELRVLDVSESNLKQLWSSSWPYYRSKKVAPNLAVLNLSSNPGLIALPDMSNHRHLKKLTLEYCVGLTKIHDSIGNLTSLAHINLKGCSNLIDFPSDVTGMKGLKELILSDCSKFRGLPHEVQSMKSLNLLLLDGTAVVQLPNYMFRLTQLEVLSLDGCYRVTCLPEWIGSLSSLKDLSLNHTKINVLPETIGSLSRLEKLSLVGCKSLVMIPDSVRMLKSLVMLYLTGSSLEELPSSICSLSYLKVLSLGRCRSLSSLPGDVKGLVSITELNLENTSIVNLPEEIRSLKFLKRLAMNDCESLATLPESIGELSNLTVLLLVGAAIKRLPDSIGRLENLTRLNLNKCRELDELPGAIGTLRSLNALMIEETAITWLPESFGMLESLRVLKMKKDLLTQNSIDGFISVLPTTFCNLSRLQEFDAKSCRISGQIRDDFNKLSKLEILDLGYNNFHSLPSTMEGLCFLRKLLLRHCENLRSLPRLSSTLEMLICADCYALESICDLSNLCCLQELQFANCYKLADIPGLECLKTLRRLYMGGCSSSSLSVKRRLSMVTLKNLTNLSIPGSEIPDWFSQEAVNFAARPNLAIKNVIIAVVVSVDFEKLGEVYRKLPSIYGIQARIIRQHEAIFTTTLNLAGVPRTLKDQLYLCRFKDYNPLVLLLKGGDVIQMTQSPRAADGVELKKWGISLVFENDDDYIGDEDLLPLSQQSVTRRLARFFLA